tara:strand:+ start:1495 stop:1776 length:282 start_codon:yes stop_codon:yes gene_type:complete
MQKAILALQILILAIILSISIYLYNYVQIINTEIEVVMSVIEEIQVILPKISATADTVSSLQYQFEEAFKTLSDLSLFFNGFLELFSQLEGNS